MRKHRVLLLGGSGFIGHNLKEAFLRDVTVEMEAPSSQELNVLQYEQVLAYLRANSFDLIINALDRKTNLSQENCHARYLEERLRMFANLADCSSLYGRMLYFGTGAEYAREWPICSIKEEDFGRKTPGDSYGLLMNTLSRLVFQKKNLYNFRLFGIFGKYEDQEKRFVSHAICCALKNQPITIRQNVVFDYLYMDDLIRMVRYFIDHEMREKAYNAVSGRKYALVEIAKIVKKLLKSDVSIQIGRPGLGMEYTANGLKIQEETGIIAEDIEISIQKLICFWREQL